MLLCAANFLDYACLSDHADRSYKYKFCNGFTFSLQSNSKLSFNRVRNSVLEVLREGRVKTKDLVKPINWFIKLFLNLFFIVRVDMQPLVSSLPQLFRFKKFNQIEDWNFLISSGNGQDSWARQPRQNHQELLILKKVNFANIKFLKVTKWIVFRWLRNTLLRSKAVTLAVFHIPKFPKLDPPEDQF